MKFLNTIQNNMDDLISDLQGCIQIPSVYTEDDSGYPYGKPVQDCLEYVLKCAEKLGFSTVNMDNQVGWCEFGEGEEMVAVLGHLDVVPEGDGWSVPPYSGLVRDGRIYGRGTMDDKGPTMCALYALKAIAESGLPLQRRIRILFGLNEETGSADMAYYKAHGGEIPVMGFTPDGEYPIINGEKGLINETYRCEFTQSGPLQLKSMWGGTAHNIVPNYAKAEFCCSAAMAAEICAMAGEKITCTATDDGVLIEAAGVNAHGGTPWEGENAIGRLAMFLNNLPLEGCLKTAVAFLAEKIGMECDGRSLGIAMRDDVSGILTMNLGVLRADEKAMEVKLNYRYPVTKVYEDCGPQTLDAFAQAGFERTVTGHKNKLYMPPEHPLVEKLLGVYHRCTGLEPAPKAIGGGTYAKMIPNVLAFGPIFPGDEVREHKPDEFMELSRLRDNTNIMAEAMYALATE